MRFRQELPHFDQATRILLEEDDNEISFIVHNNIYWLRNLQHYRKLIELGFREEACLGNKPFLKRVNAAVGLNS